MFKLIFATMLFVVVGCTRSSNPVSIYNLHPREIVVTVIASDSVAFCMSGPYSKTSTGWICSNDCYPYASCSKFYSDTSFVVNDTCIIELSKPDSVYTVSTYCQNDTVLFFN